MYPLTSTVQYSPWTRPLSSHRGRGGWHKIQGQIINNLRFAYDIVLLASSENDLQLLVNKVQEWSKKVVGRCSPCGMPSWVSDRAKQLRTERDVAKRKYLLSKSKQSREIWRKLNSSLNESYKADEMARLNKQMEELQISWLKRWLLHYLENNPWSLWERSEPQGQGQDERRRSS